MEFNSLFHLLSEILYLPGELKDCLQKHLIKRTYPKKHLLLKRGRIQERVYFIEKGIARGFYEDGNKTITSWFRQAGGFLASAGSFNGQMPSGESIELLDESTLISLSFGEVEHFYKLFPEANYIGRVLTQRYHLEAEKRAQLLRMHTAEEKYLQFLKKHPDLLQKVPLTHIASFLGMSLETLSRIRSQR